MSIKQITEELDELLKTHLQEKLEKLVIKDFIRLAKEYYGEDFNSKLKENGDKVVWNEQPKEYFTITLNICGNEEMLLSTPIFEVSQDFITEIVGIINSAIQDKEIDKLKEHYGVL